MHACNTPRCTPAVGPSAPAFGRSLSLSSINACSLSSAVYCTAYSLRQYPLLSASIINVHSCTQWDRARLTFLAFAFLAASFVICSRSLPIVGSPKRLGRGLLPCCCCCCCLAWGLGAAGWGGGLTSGMDRILPVLGPTHLQHMACHVSVCVWCHQTHGVQHPAMRAQSMRSIQWT
jgi:hypothetical protein